ncbi:MAG TPA: hypothetical protein VMF51_14710 [Nocardioides sp.]|uniref:hypothetical protein n=1 Tax=Nocardioides sp. TaxID=35761 RepID=UPI002C35B8D4|nr:hypothetical protein [Nocardioides sp.]HTW16384.1 hypothetical protein [Nocardioides sp.]
MRELGGRPPTAAADVSAAAAAAAFVAYAAGGEPDAVPWAGTVRLSIQGEPVVVLDGDRAIPRRSWRGCPADRTTIEGVTCPLSPLQTIRWHEDEGFGLALESKPPDVVGCNRYVTPPTGGGVDTAWIRPDPAHRSCLTDVAIAVTVDDTGDLTAVDLFLSGP